MTDHPPKPPGPVENIPEPQVLRDHLGNLLWEVKYIRQLLRLSERMHRNPPQTRRAVHVAR